MKYASQVANVEGLMNAVVQELKSQGVKAPKVKKLGSTKQDVKLPAKLFGAAVGLLPNVVVDENGVTVPRLLVDLLLAIEKDITVEGLFRKAGSVVRQKELRKNIENVQTWRGVQVHDIVSVMKQFLRELPEPLILSRYQEALGKAQNLEDPGVRVYTIMLLCLLLPKENLDVIRYLMLFLSQVAAHSHSNKMDAHNLAVVMTPNLTQLNEKLDKCNKTLMSQTGVVETLIINADRIGMVPDLLVEKVEFPLLGQSDDELEKSGGGGLDASQKRKKRNSLNGVLSNLRRKNTAQPKTPNNQNSMSFTTVYATPILTYGGFPVQRTASKRKAEIEPEATPIKKNVEQKPQPKPLVSSTKTNCDYVQENLVHAMDAVNNNQERISSENTSANINNRALTNTMQDKCENESHSKMKCCNEIADIAKVEIVDCSSEDISQNTRSKMRKVSFESKMDTSRDESISEETCQEMATPGISDQLSVHLRIRTSEEYQRSPRPRKVISRSLREKGSAPLVMKLHRDQDTLTPDPSLRRSVSTQSCDKLNRSSLRRGRPNTRRTGLPEPSPFKQIPIRKAESIHSSTEIDNMIAMVNDTSCREWLKDSDLFLEERKSNWNRVHIASPSPQRKRSSSTELKKISTASMEDVNEKILTSKLSESVFSLPSAAEFQFRLRKPSFEGDDETEKDPRSKILAISQESLCSSGSCGSKHDASSTEVEDDDDLGNLALSEDEADDRARLVAAANKKTIHEPQNLEIYKGKYKKSEPAAKNKSVSKRSSSDAQATSDSNVDISFVSELPRNVVTETATKNNIVASSIGIPSQKTGVMSSRRVSERLKRKSSSFSYSEHYSKQVKTKRRLSENDIRLMSHRDVVLAPLTNDTYSILTNVGALTEATPPKEDTIAPLTDSTWQPAPDALSAVGRDDIPPGGRPSLIMLKRQRAGMVSASVRKYDSISRSQCATPKAMPSPSVKALKSPLRVPSIFVRGSSTNGSIRQQQALRQSIRKNDCTANIPLTGFARRQSFNTKSELPKSGSRSAESSPTSTESPKPSYCKPRPKSFSSPSTSTNTQSPSPLKDRNTLNRQSPRVKRIPLTNESVKTAMSTPEATPVFKTPTAQAPHNRIRTPRSAGQATVITPGSQEKYQSPYRVVYQSLPRCQLPHVLNDSSKKLTKQMSLNEI